MRPAGPPNTLTRSLSTPSNDAENAITLDETLPPTLAPCDPPAEPSTLISLEPPQPLLAETPAPDGYEILGELGRGGMGVVYKARQVRMNRTEALKVIPAGGHAGADERARFLAEGEAIEAVSHPGVVQVYELGVHAGQPYFALEYCDGLKPANVLLGSDGTPKVTDFGLAKRVDGGSGLTRTGEVVGTPSYVAPEQANGDTKHVGPAAGVYALGAILDECLTGRPPFNAASAFDTILQVVADEPGPPSRLNPKVPKGLEAVCLKCLAKEPGRRYESASALAEDLGRFVQGQPVKAKPAGAVERGWVVLQ